MTLFKNTLFSIKGLFLLVVCLLSFWSLPGFCDEENQPLPEFRLPELFNTSKMLTNQSFKGQVVLLNVWASWCRYCRNEHELLLNIKQHVPIYGINLKDDTNRARQYLRAEGNPYAGIGIDWSGEVADKFGVYGTPETYLIDKKGVIRYRYSGSLDESTWKNTLWPLVQKYRSES